MDNLEDLEEKFNRLKDELTGELSGIRTNRPTPKLVEDIQAEYLQQSIPIKQLGTISVELPRNILITPWDKGAIEAVAKGVESAGLGVTVAIQGSMVRVSLPELTGERREELSRLIKKIAEEVRIKMRVFRDEVHRRVNAEPDKDEKYKRKEKLQKLVDSFNKDVDSIVNSKIDEVMQ